MSARRSSSMEADIDADSGDGGGGSGGDSGGFDNHGESNPTTESLKKSLLSTSSPEGIQIASKITPTRLANLLIRKGPLPIRHITSQLALEVSGFDSLSLSKQRRLIMAAMEQVDKDNNVVFEKIGWGQWAVRKVDSDYIVTEGTESTMNPEENANGNNKPSTTNSISSTKNTPNDKGNAKNSVGKDDINPTPIGEPINVKELRNQPNLRLGWSKKKDQKTGRRKSITNNKSNLHNVKVPNEKLSSSAIASDSEDDGSEDDDDDDNAGLEDVDEDEDDDDDDDDDDSESDDDMDEELFKFDHDIETKKSSPPIKFANRVPLKLSPPPGPGSNSRRKSSSSHSVNKNTNYNPRHQIFNRSRLNSLDNLDNYIISSAKNSNGSFGSPPPPPPNAALAAMSGSPLSSWNSSNYIHNNMSKSPDSGSLLATMNSMNSNRRKSSFNESNIRSTLSSSLPKANPPHSHIDSTSSLTHTEDHFKSNDDKDDGMSETDEEDWATIGAESLRRKESTNRNSLKDDKDETRQAAFALVDLMSV